MKTVKIYEAKHYSVNCKENDYTDIKCGGPLYLGFDFYIDSTILEKKIIKKLKKLLKENNLPYISISVLGKKLVEKLWSQTMVKKCIEDYKLY